MTFKDLAKELRPPKNGEDPASWRFKMYVAVLALTGIGLLYLLADFGAFERIGISGGARADDVEKVLEQHQTDITRLEGKVDDVVDKQDIALRLSLAAEICRLLALRTTEDSPAMRTQLTRSIQEKQEQYQVVNERRTYNIAECP